MNLLASFLANMAAMEGPTPRFSPPRSGPYADAHRHLDDDVRRVTESPWFRRTLDLSRVEGGDGVPPGVPAGDLAVAAAERLAWNLVSRGATLEFYALNRLLPRYLAGGPLDPARARDLLLALEPVEECWILRALEPVFEPVRQALAGPGGAEAVRPALERLVAKLSTYQPREARERASLEGLHTLLYGGSRLFLEPEPWTTRLQADLEAMDGGARGRWLALLRHLHAATSNKASAKWLKEAKALLDGVGADAFRERALAWLGDIGLNTDHAVLPRNGDLARGMVWLLAATGDDAVARALGDLAMTCGRKLWGVGQRSPKVMNACVAALGGMDGTAAMAEITRLRAKVKYVQSQELIAATLRAAAERRGVSTDELEEMVVPTFGMEEPGLRREALGDWTAEVRITGTTSVETVWVRADGKTQKSPPAELKQGHADDLKELKLAAAEIAKALPAQRDRLEGLFLAERVLPCAAWRERYLDHPLLAEMSRRLVWRLETGGRARSGIWREGRIVDADDAPVEGLADGTPVRLWHPLGAPPDEVRGWRAWLDRHGVTQPFKQAYREVYLLTDAERATETYSNRFAAHLLKQHQLAALARGRGWQYQLQGAWDEYSTPRLHLPRHEIVAEYLVEPVLDGEQSAMGVSLYVSTDQVRFLAGGGHPMPLAEVPPLVFSEVMRDVDLFVGVSSVGADPAWGDRGAGPEMMGGYWGSYSFGELSATAVTRREVLERLLPRLKIAPACSLDGRFLVVRGKLRTYRIHLGSGNVLMEPNDQYLCIVPDRGRAAAKATQDLVLPFEGDSTLSVVLSKAFLLAADTRITDETILRQIRA